MLGGAIGLAQLIPKKEFSVPSVAVDARLEADGAMHVVEHITYDFTGQFHYGTRPIPVGNYQITDMLVTERGAPIQSSGAPYNLTFYFDAQDEQRTFDIAYTVHGAASAGPDVAELYWKWVGEDHPTIGLVTATLVVPPGDGRLRAWGHGPLTGTVRVGSDTVRWRAPNVARGTFVEGRVAIPTARVPQLPVSSGPRLPTMLTQERAWATAANDSRRHAIELADEERTITNALSVLAPLGTVLGMTVFLLLWARYGREPRPLAPVPEYVRDLPDDPPAVVSALMHWGTVGPQAFSATVLDLAQRNFLTIRELRIDRPLLPDRTDFELTRTDADPALLHEYERTALDELFSVGGIVRQSEITKQARSHQSEALGRWNSFKVDVGTSLRNRKYINGRRSMPFLVNIAVAVVLGLIGGGAIAHGAEVLGGVALAWAAVQLALTPLLRQRSPLGHQRYLEWKGVRKFLHDFSQLADAPVGHLVLWERYLVYAAALGVSEELVRGLAARIPPEEQTAFAPWYVGAHSGPAPFATIGDFGAGIAASTSSFTPPSSGSGGGGGFSGGGGGGGGGGGIGAG